MGLLNWSKKESKNKAPNTGAHGDSRWASEADLERIGAFEEIGLPVGYVNGRPFCHPARRKPHGGVIGGTGSGKTTKVLATIALSDAASKMSLVSVETAGDWSGICLPWRSKLGPCRRVDPTDMMHGVNLGSTKIARYNPMAEYLKVSDRLRFPSRAEKLAAMSVRSKGSHDRFFYSMAQRAHQGAIMAQARYAPRNCHLPAVAKLFNDDFFEWVRWLLRAPDIDPFIRDLLKPFLVEKGKEHDLKSLLDVINTVASEMKWILNEAISDSLKGSDFNFAQLAHEVGTVTINAPISLLSDGFDRWLSMVLSCALSELQDAPGPIPVVFLLDELKQYV
jgi:type IV secretory pathway TraG/TraD family ATPase VirD4